MNPNSFPTLNLILNPESAPLTEHKARLPALKMSRWGTSVSAELRAFTPALDSKSYPEIMKVEGGVRPKKLLVKPQTKWVKWGAVWGQVEFRSDTMAMTTNSKLFFWLK